MPGQMVRNFLDQHNVKYVTITHSPAYTAQEVAESANISGKELIKTVILKMEKKFIMAVIPANKKVILELIRDELKTENIWLATEEEFKNLFPDCEIGAMPPFGNLYDMKVIMCDDIKKNSAIAFDAGSHSEIIRMNFNDFKRLVKPKIVNFTT